MNRCYLLVGVPASGKSTFIKKTTGACPVKIEVISSDNYIEERAREEGKTYNEVFQKYVNDANQYCFIRAKQLANDKEEHVVFIDRTNMTKASRKKFIDILKDTHEINCIVFKTPEYEEHQRRLKNRPGKIIPQFVIDSMEKSFQMPSDDEGFEQIVGVG